jgi:general secretion pathway protein D
MNGPGAKSATGFVTGVQTVKSVYTAVALVGIGLMITGVAVMSQEPKPAGGGAPAAAAAPATKPETPAAPSATDKPADKPVAPPQEGVAADKPAEGANPADEAKPADPNAPKAGEEKPWSLDELEKVPTTPLTPGEPMESVNLNNVEMRVILQKLGEWTGKPIIPTTDEVMRLRITIYASQTLPRSSALTLVYAALRARGIIAEHYDDKIILKPIAQARQGYIPTVAASEPLVKFADKSQIVEKFFRLQSYSPSRLVEVISPLIAEYGHVTALENTRDIVVIDTVENLIRIEQIIKQLDVPESDTVVEQVFEILNTDPGEIVQVLELILTDLKGGTRTRGTRGQGGQATPQAEAPRPQQGQRSGAPGANANPAPSVTIPSTTVPIKLIAMPKQGWIIARGTNEDIDLVAEWIKKLDIPETVPTGQTVVPVKFVDPREVANIIQSALQDMPGEVKANIVVQALSQSKQVVIFGSEENRKMVERLIAEVDLPSQNIFSQRTFTLKHADPDQIKTNIDALFDGSTSSSSNRGFGGGFGGFGGGFGRSSQAPDQVVKSISYPTQKQVTVIASEENLKKIAELIEKQWDVPLDIEKDQYRIITLKNSDPVQMTTLLTTLFTADSGSGGGNNNLIRMIFGGSGSEDEKKKIVGSLYGMLTFEAVPGTKKLIVISKIPEAYEVIEKLVMTLDREEKAEVPTVVTLKYADAEDLCEQLNAMLNEAGTTATIRRSSRGLASKTTTSSGDSSSISSGQEANAEMITPWWNRQRTTTTEAMPTSNLIGQVRFVPVHRSKAIMILSPPEYLEDLTKLITELDKPGMQVMVKVVIMEVNLSKATSIGVQLASDPSAFGTLGVNAIQALTSLSNGSTGRDYTLSGGTAAAPPNVSAPTGSTQGIGSVTSADINVLVDLLVKNANGRILNQPTLWTKDNQEATFLKGQKIAFITGSTTQNTGQTQQTVSYDTVGVTLTVKPNITPEKAVDMIMYLNVSQLELEIINGQRSRKNLDTTTRLIVRNGQSIMMGGILYQNNEEVNQKVPLLGDIPLLGELFKHKRNEVTNSELLVFVTPYVIDDKKLETIPLDPDQTPLEDSRTKLKTTLEKLSSSLDEALGKPYEQAGADTPADDAAGKTNGETTDDAAKDKPPVTTDKPTGPTAMKEN